MTNLPVETTDLVTGIDFVVDAQFGAFAGAVTYVGGTARAVARDKVTGTIVSLNSATIVDATHVRANFGGSAVPIGRHIVRVFATPVGYAEKCIDTSEWVVEAV